MRMKLGAAALLAVSLAGCTSSLNVIGDPFVAPAKFQFLRCEDIAKRQTSLDFFTAEVGYAAKGGDGRTPLLDNSGQRIDNHGQRLIRRGRCGRTRLAQRLYYVPPKASDYRSPGGDS